MAAVTYVEPDGSSSVVDVPDGTSVMRGAINADIKGIIAECGGQLMCATCHVYVEEAFLDRLPAISDDEDAMLDSTAEERLPNSRLSCQLSGDAVLDGLTVDIPMSQI
jgi:2Fe-2S ferredoxin